MQTQLDTLVALAIDGKWYSSTALGAKLHVHNGTQCRPPLDLATHPLECRHH
jgi:hypothetical protein